MSGQRSDSVAVLFDSAQAADLLRARAAGYDPVPLRVTEVREIPATLLVAPVAGALSVGLLLGASLGYWWRGRRRA